MLLYQLQLQSNWINYPVSSMLVEWTIRSTQGWCNIEIISKALTNMKWKINFFNGFKKHLHETNKFLFILFAGNICSSSNPYFYVMMELSVKHTTLIFFAQVSVVLDSGAIQIYEGCQQKINLIGHLRKKLLTMAMNFIVKDYS